MRLGTNRWDLHEKTWIRTRRLLIPVVPASTRKTSGLDRSKYLPVPGVSAFAPSWNTLSWTTGGMTQLATLASWPSALYWYTSAPLPAPGMRGWGWKNRLLQSNRNGRASVGRELSPRTPTLSHPASRRQTSGIFRPTSIATREVAATTTKGRSAQRSPPTTLVSSAKWWKHRRVSRLQRRESLRHRPRRHRPRPRQATWVRLTSTRRKACAARSRRARGTTPAATS